MFFLFPQIQLYLLHLRVLDYESEQGSLGSVSFKAYMSVINGSQSRRGTICIHCIFLINCSLAFMSVTVCSLVGYYCYTTKKANTMYNFNYLYFIHFNAKLFRFFSTNQSEHNCHISPIDLNLIEFREKVHPMWQGYL